VVGGGGDGQCQNDGMGGIEPGTGSALVIEVFIVVVVYNCCIPAASAEQPLPGGCDTACPLQLPSRIEIIPPRPSAEDNPARRRP
jgi:hypothetical protein